MSVKCDLCGMQLKASVALNAHYGSRPCKLERTAREMKSRGWAPCWAADAAYVLNDVEIEHEKAPAGYTQGGMKAETIVPNQKQSRLRKRFHHPHLEEAIWCPAWAQLIVELNIPSLKRIEILRHVNGDAKRVAAIGTVLALGGVDAVAQFSVPAEPADSAEECESATQEAGKLTL